MADTASPILFSRSNIDIFRKTLPASPPLLPWQDKGEAVQVNPRLSFDVEMRDANVLYSQEGWFNFSAPSENNGVFMAFREPRLAPITRSSYYAALDILMIDKEGKIVQIVPNIVLSELKQDIASDVPIKAFLFVRGGTCDALSIHPGDIVEYQLFKQPPLVLTTTSSSEAAPVSIVSAPTVAPAPPAPVVIKPHVPTQPVKTIENSTNTNATTKSALSAQSLFLDSQ